MNGETRQFQDATYILSPATPFIQSLSKEERVAQDGLVKRETAGLTTTPIRPAHGSHHLNEIYS